MQPLDTFQLRSCFSLLPSPGPGPFQKQLGREARGINRIGGMVRLTTIINTSYNLQMSLQNKAIPCWIALCAERGCPCALLKLMFSKAAWTPKRLHFFLCALVRSFESRGSPPSRPPSIFWTWMEPGRFDEINSNLSSDQTFLAF